MTALAGGGDATVTACRAVRASFASLARLAVLVDEGVPPWWAQSPNKEACGPLRSAYCRELLIDP